MMRALALFACAVSLSAAAAGPVVGRPATADEIKAWDIDVRADFKGLPKGAGSVAQGEQVWEGRCASCHGTFGESNHVFTPLVGGTSAADAASGHVASLARGDVPQRSTMMKLAHLSSLWDYINRAMPWNAPKTLSTNEVYAVTAYLLNLAEIVPSDFVLSERNMGEVQQRLPNRNGLMPADAMWQTRGKGDVRNPACMHDCAAEATVESFLPESARNAHGNLAEQNRLVGQTRGTPTNTGEAGHAVVRAPSVATLLAQNGCTACHGVSNRIVGPGLNQVAAKYNGKPGAQAYLAAKIRSGGSGLWGAIPMPPQGQIKDSDIQAIAAWLAAGAKQ
ncbi:MAG: c-type cytochrome [Pseudomonadota bacterium]